MKNYRKEDRRLIAELQRRVLDKDPDWTCAGRAERDGAHGLFQYPAMMVPSMQREILSLMVGNDGQSMAVLDPFVGSGTVLTEALAAGQHFVGYDINPLAVLVSRVKAMPLLADDFAEAADEVRQAIAADKRTDWAISFPNIGKWFCASNIIGLSRIRRAIESLEDISCRRFLWVALAETIRRCSNSRTSTYKLHIRTPDDLIQVKGKAIPIFLAVLGNNVRCMRIEKARIEAQNPTSDKVAVHVYLQSICEPMRHRDCGEVDIVLTSPPYGDNRTTVPYGQFSYLALRWIPHGDIDPSIKSSLLETTHTLDTASLGGSLRSVSDMADDLRVQSPTYDRMRRKLIRIDSHAADRWTAYCRDLSRSLDHILKRVRVGGRLAWTIGQRRIRGIGAPLVDVMNELHVSKGATVVTNIRRRIPVKRMPTHNSLGSLMQSEHVCFYRRT